ncbi:MAG: siphovirus Gp157 family protein [[Eubacterium] siraeum]
MSICVTKPEPKTAIKEAIKSGKEVAGAHLEDTLSLQIK